MFRRVWRKARKAVLIEHEYSSPVGKRAYDLRHTCLTTWLNNGIPPAQVAAWAGNSVPVLLAISTRCITGELTELQGRIEEPQRLPTVPAAVKGPSKNFGKFSGKPAAESRSKPAPAGLTPSPPGAVPALPKLPRRVRQTAPDQRKSPPQGRAGHRTGDGAPGRTRTCGQVLRRHLLYPLSYGGRVWTWITDRGQG